MQQPATIKTYRLERASIQTQTDKECFEFPSLLQDRPQRQIVLNEWNGFGGAFLDN
jgi:hypothetical protein